MAQAFSILFTWKEGNPHLIIEKEEGEAPESGLILSWQDGGPCIIWPTGIKMEVKMPSELGPDGQMTYSIGVASPERIREVLDSLP